MEQKESYADHCKEIRRSLMNIATKNQFSLIKVMEIYNHFNDILYREYLAKTGKVSMYKYSLEEKSRDLTEWYFSLPRN